MPELAEVALYARDAAKAVRGEKVLSVSFPNQKTSGKKIVPPPIQKRFNSLIGKKIILYSAGKGLFLSEAHSKDPTVEFRLGMTGQFRIDDIDKKWAKHSFVEIQFKDHTLYYLDPRRFGRVRVPTSTENAIGGFDGVRNFWTAAKPVPPKGFLTKPRISWLLGTGDKTGVGNYMANEALGLLKLSPFEPCKNEAEAIKLLKKCGEISKKIFEMNSKKDNPDFYAMKEGEGLAAVLKFYQNPKVPRMSFQGRPLFTHFKK